MKDPVDNLRITFSSKFTLQLKKAPYDVKIAFRETLELFIENPLDPHSNLRSHSLKKQYTGYRSIDITDDWRALFKIQKDKSKITITFHLLGTHAQLYGELHK